MTTTITPVILCGGSGTRLWPLSRRSYPKQFAPLLGADSLFQHTARRVTAPGFAPPMIVTGVDFRFIVAQQLTEAGIDPGAIVIEPVARNTAPALLAAALVHGEEAADDLMLAAPSDQHIPDADAFRAALATGVDAALGGRIVTFGVTPERPETGYGYLEPEARVDGLSPLRRFVEKPALAEAEAMLREGRHLWNAGLFLYTARTLIAAFEAHAPEVLAQVREAVEHARPDLGFLRLDAPAWSACPDISVDFAVMEKAGNLDVVRLGGEWSDLGGWETMYRRSDPDAQGVALQGEARAFDCRNSLLRSESGGQRLIGLGLDNVVAVAMPDAVLVADRRRVDELGGVVAALREAGVVQADSFPKVHRPWGHFETLILGDRFRVKRIVIDPGGTLSKQRHLHRAEHWVVVAGTARVTIDESTRLVSENESVFVPLGAVHRLENPGKLPVVLIEVQTGAYLAEDDISRLDDVYARGEPEPVT